MKKILIVCTLLFAMVLSACGNDKELVGEWEDTIMGISSLKFNDDGTVVADLFDEKVEGTYETSNGKIKMEANGGTREIEYSIDGDTLQLSVGGESMEFERVK